VNFFDVLFVTSVYTCNQTILSDNYSQVDLFPILDSANILIFSLKKLNSYCDEG